MVCTAQQLLGSCIFTRDSHDIKLGAACDHRMIRNPSIQCNWGKRPYSANTNNGKKKKSNIRPSPPYSQLSSSNGWSEHVPTTIMSCSSEVSRDRQDTVINTLPAAVIIYTDSTSLETADTRGCAVLDEAGDQVDVGLVWPAQLLTELQRSLLENQWSLTTSPLTSIKVSRGHDDALKDAAPSGCSSSTMMVKGTESATIDQLVLVRSGKPSARQRRRLTGSQVVITCPADSDAVDAVTSSSTTLCAHADVNAWTDRKIQNALATVTTLGLRARKELLTKEEEVILSKKMKVGQNLKAAKTRLVEVLGYEPSNEEWASTVNLTTAQLQSRILEAERARDQMFVSNLRLVFSLANKYSALGVSLADLIQEGALGLLRGLEKFDYTKGFKLSTYIHWWIRQGITRALADHSRTVRLPAHMHERLNAINKTAAILRMSGIAVSLKSLSQAANMSDEMVTVALKATKRMVSLDKAKSWGFFNPEDDSMHNYVADRRPDNDPWVAVEKMFARDDVDSLLAKYLSKRERDIVKLHYGLGNAYCRGLSLEKISFRYGISRERVRQIEGRALRKLAATGLKKDFENSLYK